MLDAVGIVAFAAGEGALAAPLANKGRRWSLAPCWAPKVNMHLWFVGLEGVVLGPLAALAAARSPHDDPFIRHGRAQC